MKTSDQIGRDFQAELARRHAATVRVVVGLLTLTAILSIIAFVGKDRFRQQSNPSADIAVRITILILGLGSVVFRRTRFATMRLQDITALLGVSGLLRTLAGTTLQIAVIGATISILGFGATLMTGNDFYTYGAGLVGFVVLLYCYPTRASWERAVRKFAQIEPQPPNPPTF